MEGISAIDWTQFRLSSISSSSNVPICKVHVAQIFRGSDFQATFTTMN